MPQPPPDSTTPSGPDEYARKAAHTMFASDHASQSLGMVIEAMSASSATLTMRVRDDMVNGHGTCHGGFIFTLADSVCAFVSNAREAVMVLQSSTITYLNPASPGVLLTARGEMRALRGRSGIVDVTVSDEAGVEIALFRGIVRAIGVRAVGERGSGLPGAPAD